LIIQTGSTGSGCVKRSSERLQRNSSQDTTAITDMILHKEIQSPDHNDQKTGFMQGSLSDAVKYLGPVSL